MKMRLPFILALGTCIALAGGCGPKAAPETETESETALETVPETVKVIEETETETEASLPEGQMYSFLTGQPVSKQTGMQRPYCIMLNNVQDALPQSDISYAEMVYEAEVEGGITRLMGVFQDDSKLEKVGSIRSARHYYVDFSNDNQGIYVHFGQSSFAADRIANDHIEELSGLTGYGSQVFYRSSDRVAPHNVYTNKDMLAKGLSICSISRDYPKGYKGRLTFNTEDTVPAAGTAASLVRIPFDSQPYFEYNTKDRLYLRSQYGQPHIDGETGQQLSFKNIIVQYVPQKSISNQDHQDLTLNGSGKGWFITDGKAQEITWSRKDKTDVTRYYLTDGSQISLNPGKTFFEVVPDDKTVTFQ